VCAACSRQFRTFLVKCGPRKSISRESILANAPRCKGGADMRAPTLEEVGRARPPRGNGAPSRTRSHYERILALLRERGPAGVLSSELYDAPNLYGRSPRNRISEMRQDGHLIETAPASASVVRYVLIRDCEGAAPPSECAAVSPNPVSNADWFTATGKPRPSSYTTGLPLFDPEVR